MNITIRPGTVDDSQICGDICYRAFTAIADQHNFPHEFPSSVVTTAMLYGFLDHAGHYGAVAEIDDKIVGSNFVDERSAIAGIGPITVDPAEQNRAVGRELMQHILDRESSRQAPGIRLVQAAYHNRSLSLYTKLGFSAREPLSLIQGPALGVTISGRSVRAATDEDLSACNRLCRRVHGHDRSGELEGAIDQGTAHVVEHHGHITGYTTAVAFFGHSVADSNEDIKALISAAATFPGPGFLLPTRNADLLRWCLQHGLHIVQPMTLMSIGLYNEPTGAYLTSILY